MNSLPIMNHGLRFVRLNTYEQLSQQATELICEAVRAKPGLLLCAATGGSPRRTYELLVEKKKNEPHLFDRLRILKLDEWGGMPANVAASSERYLRERLLDPLEIPATHYFTFGNDEADPAAECARLRAMLAQEGPPDLSILGMGGNGHLAMNEPADQLTPHAHVAALTAHSQAHQMLESLAVKPSYGVTLGIADILLSRKILLLINGAHKREAMRRLQAETISTQFPASLLRLHPDALCLCDAEAWD